MNSFTRCIASIVAFLLFAVAISWAQYGASLQGTISDKTGAVVTGASVNVINQASGVIHNTVSTDSGFYRVSGLNPGLYRVEVEAGSFKKSVTPNVAVPAEVVTGLNVALEPGSAQEVVQVVGENVQLQTENANVTNTLSTREVVNLPKVLEGPSSKIACSFSSPTRACASRGRRSPATRISKLRSLSST